MRNIRTFYSSRRAIRALALAAFASWLAGCSAQPGAPQSFSVEGAYPRSGEWWLKSLGSEGRIELTAHLLSLSDRATNMVFKLGNRDLLGPRVSLSLSDRECVGAYSLALSHESAAKMTSIDYLSTRLPWDTPLHLRMTWSKGLLTITVNDNESKTVPIDSRLSNMLIEVHTGGVRIENLTHDKRPDNAVAAK